MTETRGRKLKLNNDLIVKMEKLLKTGNYVVTICNSLGFSEETYYNWKKEAVRIKTEYETNPHKRLTKRDILFLDFLESVKSAEARAETRNVALIQKAAITSWQAAMTFLERRHPDRWSRHDKLDADHTIKGAVKLISVKDTIKKYEKALDEITEK